MEEFKIVSIPTQDSKNESNVEEELARENEEEKALSRKRFWIVFILLCFVVFSIFVIQIVTKYTDYEIENTWERKDSAEVHYVNYENNLLKYSNDGVFYTSYNGSLIWNYTYDMTSPELNIQDSYLVIYDKKGTEVDIFSTTGYINTLKMKKPIVDVQIGKQGTIGVLLQESSISYIQMYNPEGTLLVSGEIHPENGGYPISLALSEDAKRMLVSMINLNKGKISSELVFYDFSKEGKKEVDNICAKYEFADMIFPQVEFLKGDKAVAFGNGKILLFNNNKKATVLKEIDVNEEIQTVVYNDSYFGYVSDATDKTGEISTQLKIFNLFGIKRFSKKIPPEFSKIEFLKRNEVLVETPSGIRIYNIEGFLRFEKGFSEKIYKIVPGETMNRYYLIKDKKTEKIHIK